MNTTIPDIIIEAFKPFTTPDNTIVTPVSEDSIKAIFISEEDDIEITYLLTTLNGKDYAVIESIKDMPDTVIYLCRLCSFFHTDNEACICPECYSELKQGGFSGDMMTPQGYQGIDISWVTCTNNDCDYSESD
jgi:hypothetical protein